MQIAAAASAGHATEGTALVDKAATTTFPETESSHAMHLLQLSAILVYGSVLDGPVTPFDSDKAATRPSRPQPDPVEQVFTVQGDKWSRVCKSFCLL